MPVAQYQGHVTVPLWQHPLDNPFTLAPSCSGGTVCVASINSGNGKTGSAMTVAGYNQPAVASWRKRNHSLISNVANTNLGTNNNLYNQFYMLFQQQLFWKSANTTPTGDGTENYCALIGCPDKVGTVLWYPESNSASRIIGHYPNAGITSDRANLLVTLNKKPGIMNPTNRFTPSLGYVLNSFDASITNAFTNLHGIAAIPTNGLSIALSCPDFTNDNNNFLSFTAGYPQYAQIQYNYMDGGIGIVQTDILTFDNGQDYWADGANWNESANGFVYKNGDPLNGVPQTVIFLSRDMTKWYQIVFQPQDTASTYLVSQIGQYSDIKPMQDDEGTWFLNGHPGSSSAMAVSLPPATIPPPIHIPPDMWNNLPITLPCVKIC
jgi:hypothetical protein